MSETKPPARRGNPNWLPGVSGNPDGRPSGRTKIVQLKQELEIAVRDHLRPGSIKKILDKMVSLAQEGDTRAAKLILDKVLSNAGEASDPNEAGGGTFIFQVKNLTLKHDEPKPVLDGQFEVITTPQEK